VIYLYPDGGCRKDGFGAWAFVAMKEGSVALAACGSGTEDETTSQRMELRAAIHGLEVCEIEFPDEPITVVGDSAYVINCFLQQWYVKWFHNGWMTANGPVKNRDLWEQLFRVVGALNGRREPANLILETLTWVHVRGHGRGGYNVHGNELADEMCTALLEAA